MADYQITCTKRAIVPPQDHDHLVEVGIAGNLRWTVREVIALMGGGNTFHTLARGRRAEVDAYHCHCGYTTLRTDADNTKADNLDALPSCQ
jgi:hypothetical protein